MDNAQAAIAEFLRNVRFADLLDVLLVTALIYVAISWLRSGASRTVVVIIGAGVTLFVLANAMNMYLTQMLLEALFAVVVVTFVVLFQGEIRRELDRLAAYGLRWRRKQAEAAPHAYEVLAHVAARLAKERTGALVVVRGKEPLEHLIEGGVALHGDVSETLLCSLFHPESPGHDGAVLVDGGRVARFGAHLPLSVNAGEIGPRGTRHAAGLGLSERSDALVIVVSEERGAVSVAEGGRLQTLRDPAELKDRLARFWIDKHAPPKAKPARRWRTREAGVVALSAVLATVFWLVLAYETETVHRLWEAPIEYRNVPASVELINPPTVERVTLSGTPQALRRVEARELVLQLDVAGIGPGLNILPVEPENLDLPPGVTLEDPAVIELAARPAPPRRRPAEE